MKQRIMLCTAFLVLAFSSCRQEDPEVKLVPEPAYLDIRDGNFRLSSQTLLTLSSDSEELRLVAACLQERILKASGLRLDPQVKPRPDQGIHLTTEPITSSEHPEAYELVVTGSAVRISGNTAQGVFYGIQSLLQLLSPRVYGEAGEMQPDELRIRQVVIRDEPRYPWRGMQLDLNRDHVPVDLIRKYIDLMSMHKMNVLFLNMPDSGAQISDMLTYAHSRFVEVKTGMELQGDRFDFNSGQGDSRYEPPAGGEYLPMEKLYAFEPVATRRSEQELSSIVGVQDFMLTDNDSTGELFEYMAFPRMCALAEVGWSPREARNYEDFLFRMSGHYARLESMGVNYRRPQKHEN